MRMIFWVCVLAIVCCIAVPTLVNAADETRSLTLDSQQSAALWHAVYRGAKSTFCDMLQAHWKRSNTIMGGPGYAISIRVPDPLLENPLEASAPKTPINIHFWSEDRRGFEKGFEILAEATKIRKAAEAAGFKKVVLVIAGNPPYAGMTGSDGSVWVFASWDPIFTDNPSAVVGFIKTALPQGAGGQQ